MDDSKGLVLWPHSGPPIHFDDVWDLQYTKETITFMFKDAGGRVMQGFFTSDALAGYAVER